MSQGFKGQLEGYYVGTSSGSASSPSASAERYKLRIYRALVRDIEVLGPATPLAKEEGDELVEAGDEPASDVPANLPDDCFYQAKIDNARLFGILPRSCFEGTIYDIAVSELEITHTTKEGNKTYGRVVGEIYGRFLLPVAAHDDDEEVIETELREVEPPVATTKHAPLSDLAAQQEVKEDPADRGMEKLHPPASPRESAEHEPARAPVPFLAIVVAIILGLTGGARPALLWLGVLTPLVIVRLILAGQFKVNSGQRVFGAILVLVQFACLGLLMLEWWEVGCKTINVWAIAGIGIVALMASVLPSPVPLLCAGASLGVVLFLFYSNVGPSCEPPEETPPGVKRPADRPGVHDPGVPRTNQDGSWPRRPVRRTQ